MSPLLKNPKIKINLGKMMLSLKMMLSVMATQTHRFLVEWIRINFSHDFWEIQKPVFFDIALHDKTKRFF